MDLSQTSSAPPIPPTQSPTDAEHVVDLPETVKRPAVRQSDTIAQILQLARRYHWLVAFLLYTLVTLAVNYHIVFHLNDRIIGEGNIAQGDNMWYVWWLDLYRHSINTLQDPAYTRTFFALGPQVQIFGISAVNGLMGYVLQFVFTPLETYNLLLLIHFILSGLMMYLLAGLFTDNRIARFAAGFFYAFCTYHFARTFGHLTLATLEWLPFCAWATFVFFRNPSIKRALVLGLAIALVPLTDAYYIGYFLIPFMLLFLVGKLITDYHWFLQVRNLLLGGLAALTAFLIALPFMWNYIHVDPDTQAALKEVGQSSTISLSADLASFFLPLFSNPILGVHTLKYYAKMFPVPPVERGDYLGMVVLGLVVAGFIFFREMRNRINVFWAIMAVAGVVLALGPVLQVLGHTYNIPLPYLWLFNYPLVNSFRAPNRLVIVSLVALSVLAAMTMTYVFRHYVKDRADYALLCIGVFVLLSASLAENAQELPAAPVTIPSVYYQIAADKSDSLLLDLPINVYGSDHFYQTIHHKRMVGGYAARPTEPQLRSVQNIPYLSLFDYGGSSAGASPEVGRGENDIYPLYVTLERSLQENNIAYVLLHRDHVFPALYTWEREYLFAHLGTPIYDGAKDGVTAWHIPAGPPIDPTLYRFQLGTGWLTGLQIDHTNNVLERSFNQGSQLILYAPHPGMVHLSFNASVGAPLPLDLQTIVNGTVVQKTTIGQPNVIQKVDLGQVLLHAGNNLIELQSAQYSPGIAISNVQLVTP